MKLTHKSGAFGGCKAWRPQRPGEAPAISGRHMPNFLTSDASLAKHPELAEIAGLEKALADAFDGPDSEPLTLAPQLAAIAPEQWTRLVFAPPTATRLTLKTNAADIWSALRDETAPPVPR